MARNGAGTYVLPSGNPVVTGTTISSTTTNNTFNDIGTALTQSISSDGQTTPTANLPMGGFAHTNVANATVRTQYATAGQVQDSAFTLLTSVSGTNAITATAALGMSSYVAGQRFSFIAAGTNTGATTLNINSIGAIAVTKSGTTALVSGDIVSGAVYQVIYDGTEFQILNPTVPANVSSFSAGTTGFTPSTATTGAVTLAGTLAIANGGTNNASLAVTSGGLIYADGSKLVTSSAGTAGQFVLSGGTGTPTFLTMAAGASFYYRLNSAITGANISTAQSIFNVGVTLSASTVYEFEMFIPLSKTVGATSHSIGLSFAGTATINNISYTAMSTFSPTAVNTNSGTADSQETFIQTTANTATTGATGSSTQRYMTLVKGTVSINAGGTFIPQYTLSAAPGGAYTTNIGAYIKLSPIGASGANTNIGGWA